MANVLSLRDIERQVSGSYNLGSLRLNENNKLEHVNSHAFKENCDGTTKAENRAVREAINAGFRLEYEADAVMNPCLMTALDQVRNDLLHVRPEEELSRDEVRAMLKGLYRISKGGRANEDAGMKWIMRARVIRELKAGNVVVDKDYKLVGKNGEPNQALEDYRQRCNNGADVKLNSDFLRGCKWGGTKRRWDRTIRSGTGEKKSAEIVLSKTPDKIKSCFRDRLKTTLDANQRMHVSFDTKGWGPNSRAVAKNLAWMLQNSLNNWCTDEILSGGQVTAQTQQTAVEGLLNEFSTGLFNDDKGLVAKFLAGEPSLYNFAESKPKEHLKRVLLKGYNDEGSGKFPGLYDDFLRVGEGMNLNGWLNVSGPWPTDIPYTFEKTLDGVKVKKGDKVGGHVIMSENQSVIKRLCAIKNEKVRKMVTCFNTVDFDAILFENDLFTAPANDKNSRKTLKKSPFAGYLLMDGNKGIVTATIPPTRGEDQCGRTDVNISEDGNTVELTVRKLVTLERRGGELGGPLERKPLKKPVCVEYKLTITPGEGDGDPNVTVTSAKVLPNVSTIKPDEFFQTVVRGLDQLDDSVSQVHVGDPENPTPIEKIALDLERFKGLFKLYFADGKKLFGEGMNERDFKLFEGQGFTLAELIENKDAVLAKWRSEGGPLHKWLADAVENALNMGVPLADALALNMRVKFVELARNGLDEFSVDLAAKGFLKGMRRATDYELPEKKELVRLHKLAREREREIREENRENRIEG